ncbi:putative odorant receptor 69a [Calliphora vicina]|uniref:putative odorant receptor 69a n=1 Tax=Calliphora vicina TaxID=7373 RepID=UPI00325BB811
MAKTYQLYDFMYYPNIAFKMSAIQPFTWSGALTKQHHSPWCTAKWFITKFWFIFGATNLIYQTIGMFIYLLAPQSAHLYTAANMEPEYQIALVAQISETGGIMGLTLVAACKMFIMFWHGKRIAKLLEELQEIFPHEHVQHDSNALYRVQYFAKISGNLMKRTMIFFIFAFCFYNSLPFLEIIYEHFAADQHIMYLYQSNTWYPWQTKENSKTWWNFTAAYLCQLQSSLTGVSFIMAGEFMLCFFITQMQMHFDYLRNALRSLNAASAKANEELKILIIYHIKLLRFSKEINIIFNISFLVNFITSSVAICLMAFSMVMISMSHTFKYSVGLLSFLVFNFFICYNGSEFTTSSDELMPSAFYNNWYDGDISYRRMILFFMMRSCESNVLRAYKFATVSMPTFMAILKLSYQLFTFVSAVG